MFKTLYDIINIYRVIIMCKEVLKVQLMICYYTYGNEKINIHNQKTSLKK